MTLSGAVKDYAKALNELKVLIPLLVDDPLRVIF